MAFNPFKNRKVSEPVFAGDPNDENTNQDDLMHHDASDTVLKVNNVIPSEIAPTNTNQNTNTNLVVDSTITDSNKANTTNTKEVSDSETNKPKFNRNLLENISLSFILEQLNAEKKSDNLYVIYDNEITLKENKWYNKTIKSGRVNAISLVKHLFALDKKLDEKANDKALYFQACEYLNEIQKKQPDIVEKVVEQITTPTSTSNNVKSNYPIRTPEENAQYWKALTEQLKNISLNLVMEHIGANPNEDGQRGKWKVWSTGDNIGITGQKWHSWKAQKGGNGAISLLSFHLATLNNIDERNEESRKALYKMVISELIKTFGDGDLSMIAGDVGQIEFKVPFSMPHIIDFKLNKVREYLHEKRQIPMWIINKQIKAGLLFAGFPSDWTPHKYLKNPSKMPDDNVWATFLSYHGTAAEMRAIDRTDQYAKVLAKGSEKDLGGFVLKAEKDVSEKTVATLEAAIDSMTYQALFPGRVATSCMGVNFNLAIKAAIEALDRNYNFQFAFDNDQAGNEAAIRFREELIIELGEDEYIAHANAGRINYFDLGLRCLKESIDKQKTFYLDVQDNSIGLDVVKLFQDQAIKRWDKDTVKKWIAEGSIKYLNVCPSFSMVVDVEKEAQLVYSKLSSGKPYYLRIDPESESDEDNANNAREKRAAFLTSFKKIAGEKYKLWEDQGNIIYSKIAIAKDWNDYFIYKKQNDLELIEKLKNDEATYIHYSENKEENNNKKKIKP